LNPAREAASPSGASAGKSTRPVPTLGKAVAANHIHHDGIPEAMMQSRNKILDDLGQLMQNALGVAQGAKVEAETAMRSLMDRWLADRNLVTRDEFDAVRAMAQKAREENEVLKARLDALEPAKAKRKPKEG
jgi:BMFP domain-containing protein YqiC